MKQVKKCPLCFESVDELHKNSHVVPQWLFRETSNSKNTAMLLNANELSVDPAQSSWSGSFLCNSCEVETSKYDRYAANLLGSDRARPKGFSARTHSNLGNNANDKVHIWTGLNFAQFQKFVFSIILRAHFYLLNLEKTELLKPHVLDKMRKLYQSKWTNSDSIYPIYLHIVSDGPMIIMPIVNRVKGFHVVQLIAGTYFFEVYISSHQCLDLLPFRLTEQGTLTLLEFKKHELGIVTGGLPKLREIHQLNRDKIARLFKTN